MFSCLSFCSDTMKTCFRLQVSLLDNQNEPSHHHCVSSCFHFIPENKPSSSEASALCLFFILVELYHKLQRYLVVNNLMYCDMKPSNQTCRAKRYSIIFKKGLGSLDYFYIHLFIRSLWLFCLKQKYLTTGWTGEKFNLIYQTWGINTQLRVKKEWETAD